MKKVHGILSKGPNLHVKWTILWLYLWCLQQINPMTYILLSTHLLIQPSLIIIRYFLKLSVSAWTVQVKQKWWFANIPIQPQEMLFSMSASQSVPSLFPLMPMSTGPGGFCAAQPSNSREITVQGDILFCNGSKVVSEEDVRSWSQHFGPMWLHHVVDRHE